MQYNIYFRKENWDKFKQEENKSALVNSLLESHYGLAPSGVLGRETSVVKAKLEPEDDFKQFLKDYSEVGIRKAPHPLFGYPCCHKKSPCRHWAWEESSQHWVNTLTGEIKDE